MPSKNVGQKCQERLQLLDTIADIVAIKVDKRMDELTFQQWESANWQATEQLPKDSVANYGAGHEKTVHRGEPEEPSLRNRRQYISTDRQGAPKRNTFGARCVAFVRRLFSFFRKHNRKHINSSRSKAQRHKLRDTKND